MHQLNVISIQRYIAFPIQNIILLLSNSDVKKKQKCYDQEIMHRKRLLFYNRPWLEYWLTIDPHYRKEEKRSSKKMVTRLQLRSCFYNRPRWQHCPSIHFIQQSCNTCVNSRRTTNDA